MIGARWRPPLRIARRTARRSPGRTALVAALVAAPVLGASFLSTAFRTADLSPAEEANRALGAADAVLEVTPYERIDAVGPSSYAPRDTTAERDSGAVRPERLLPAGTRLVRTGTQSPVRFANGDRVTVADGTELDTRDPITAGLHHVRKGRLPAGTGELALSPSLADRLGVRVGDTVRPSGTASATVVGLAVEPSCRSCLFALGLPGWTGTAAASPSPRYLLDLPAGAEADRALRDRLAASGVLLTPRDAYLHPRRWEDGTTSGGTDTGTLGIALLVVGIGLFEVVLLAGTAFAVAARRQVRDVALVLSNGGRRADVRRMLLAQGAVLGLIGGVTGVALGIAAVLAAWRGLERLANQDFGGLIVSPRDLVVVALVGLVSGIAAAVVPAWSASRVPVVRALAGRFGTPSALGRRLGLGGALVAALGLALAGVVSWRWAAAREAYREAAAAASAEPAVSTYGQTAIVSYPAEPGLVYAALMLVGFGLAMVGLTVFAPSLVGFAGRAAGRLWLTGRLAVRDAARHRHRTGPAVGAVMVAVAGSVAVAFAVASYDQRDRDAYRPQLPAGWASGYLATGDPRTNGSELLAAARAAAVELPGGTVVPLPGVEQRSVPDGYVDWGARPECGSIGGVGVGDPVARLVTGARGDEAAAALAAGRAVVTNPCLLTGGTATVRISAPLETGPDGTPTGPPPEDRLVPVPAVLIPGVGGESLPTGILSTATAARLGLAAVDRGNFVITTDRVPTADEEDRATAALGTLGSMRVERGYGAPYLPGFLALIGGAGLVTLAGGAISVSLSAAEGRADLATLAAVGAPPRRRRGLAMVQAALVAGLGAGLGVLLGATIGAMIMSGLDTYPLVVPWATVLAVGFGVPALGVLIVGLATRSRLPMVRRLT